MIPTGKRDFLINRIVDKMTGYLMEDYGMTLPVALRTIYESHTYGQLQIEEYELYAQSPSYIYEFLKGELRA